MVAVHEGDGVPVGDEPGQLVEDVGVTRQHALQLDARVILGVAEPVLGLLGGGGGRDARIVDADGHPEKIDEVAGDDEPPAPALRVRPRLRPVVVQQRHQVRVDVRRAPPRGRKIVQVTPQVDVGEDEEGLGSRVGGGVQAVFFLKSGRRYGKPFRAIVTIVARPEGADETEVRDVALGDDADGRIVTVRAIEPEDAPALRRAFAQLSAVSRYRRFQRDVPEMTEEMASYLTRVDGVSHLAWIAVHVSPDLKDERIVGVARAIRLADQAGRRRDRGHRRRRLPGARARADLARVARSGGARKGIRAFRAEVLASNEPVARSLDTLVAGTPAGGAAGLRDPARRRATPTATQRVRALRAAGGVTHRAAAQLAAACGVRRDRQADDGRGAPPRSTPGTRRPSTARWCTPWLPGSPRRAPSGSRPRSRR